MNYNIVKYTPYLNVNTDIKLNIVFNQWNILMFKNLWFINNFESFNQLIVEL